MLWSVLGGESLFLANRIEKQGAHFMNQDLTTYYKDRAKEYDKVYQIPEEQDDLLKATSLFQTIYKNKSVLEIACGTGYWTEQISKTATSILATDINKAVIDIAKTRNIGSHVTFEERDMSSLKTGKIFEGIFGGFIWSHILIQDISGLLDKLNNQVVEGGVLAFIDSKQVEGTSHDIKRITRVDEYGNTYQTRNLENGAPHEVLKNFPTPGFLFDKLAQFTTAIEIIDLQYYWIATCKKKTPILQ